MMKPKGSGSVRLCVGLDSSISLLPARFLSKAKPQLAFNQWIIEQTAPFACSYKLNTAFYEERGAAGWQEMVDTAQYLRTKYPDKLTIADAKRADIGNTNRGYVKALFDEAGFDAITLNPYLGEEALQPFLEREDKVCILLAKTSNPGSGEFQDLPVIILDVRERRYFSKIFSEHRSLFADQIPAETRSTTSKVNTLQIKLWQHVAYRVSRDWKSRQRTMLVVGATYPQELSQARLISGRNYWLLVPGVGAQGGDMKTVIECGSGTKPGDGVLINVGRNIIFAEDPAEVAHQFSTAE